MPYDTITYEVAQTGVATIALNQPQTRNALSDELLTDLIAALQSARDDDAVRCVVLTSTHDRVFSSGGNLGGFAADQALVHKHFETAKFARVFALLGELGKPSICAANGHVLAGSLGLALACDLIVAKDTARFGTPEINVGLFPFMIMALIYRNVGRKKTAEMMLLGEQMSAAEAERIGIVNRVVPADEFGQVPGADETGQGCDVPTAGHGLRRRGRLPAFPADHRLLHRGHPGGRQGVFREARTSVAGPLTAKRSP
jgi:enoyl-CoA hydratase